MISVGVIGATGYAGVELTRLLLGHPGIRIAGLSSVTFEGKAISEVYPGFAGLCDVTLTDMDKVIEDAEVVFASLPHGLSEEIAEKCAREGRVLVDLGADFRLHDEGDYREWYGLDYSYPELHKKAVYGLSELYREKIKAADIIANPGCYPTSVALGLAPAMKNGLVLLDGIVIDSKSGVTGAGRSLTQNTHFPEANESISAYKAGCHRHTPEIEQTLSELAGERVAVTFVPHLLPVNRGIESTIYCRLKESLSLGEIHKIYTEFYLGERFVRVMPEGEYAAIKNVRCSNYCDISLHCDIRTNTLIISTVIDNMVKGAAGQAIQNMNIRCGFDESAGLLLPPAII
ncbi:MAG: N-acetyl-gamma-glutamyl-phosphate reductase [Eubacteriales bacterium]|jgi:N-acetyl-gamma-glutamyl-phosphate reductase|nr:N-acetyl-gamma-glutamyl-phosphate reductase [Clostridiales bacterium]